MSERQYGDRTKRNERLPDIFAQATQYFEAGALDDAKAACHELIARTPALPDRAPPDRAPVMRLLGLIAAAQQSFAEARALLARLDARFDQDAMVHTALAEAVWATDGAEAALPHLTHVLRIDPARHRVRGRLGAALLQLGQPAAAQQELLRALSGRPEDAGLHLHLGRARRELGDLGGAIDAFRSALRHDPGAAHYYTTLGDALLDAGDVPAAMAALAEALQRDPASHVAWMLLGRAATLNGQGARAIGCFRRALAQVPADGVANVQAALANALHETGQHAEAAGVFAEMMHRDARAKRRCPPRVRCVAVLAAPGAANTPTDFLLDREALFVQPLFVLPGYDYPIAALRDRFDVLFNAVSDPDAAPAALRQAANLSAAIGRVTLNPPSAVACTTRDAMAHRLTGLAGIIMPITIRCDRAALGEGLPAALRFPVLLRPIGSHGGKGLVRVDTQAALSAERATMSSTELYVTQYHGFGSPDGFWRKYRVIFVGATPYPYHVSIGSDWLNHYFRTETNRDANLQAEEAEFLCEPAATLGERAWHSLLQLPRIVGLDYFGVDFALDAQGRVIIFECNAAMRVRAPRETAGPKAEAAERIRAALTQVIMG